MDEKDLMKQASKVNMPDILEVKKTCIKQLNKDDANQYPHVSLVKMAIIATIIVCICIMPINSLAKNIMQHIAVDSEQKETYSVKVEKDGIYAEAIPDPFINNTGQIFKKYVKKAMKYYNKYKDADDYTYVSKVPEEYRDFIPVAKQIQDSDEIIIKHPFYIYYPSPEAISEGGINECCFFAEKNGKKLCMFSIYIEWDTGKVSFRYDKMADSHFICDEETVGETLFYGIDETIYAETPDKVSTVWARKSAWGEGQQMMGDDENEIDWEAEWAEAYQTFKEKSYNEKKDEIFADLTGTKKGIAYKKAEKKVEKSLKRELKDAYVEPETDMGESDRTSINIVIAISIIVLEVLAVGIIYMKKREKD